MKLSIRALALSLLLTGFAFVAGSVDGAAQEKKAETKKTAAKAVPTDQPENRDVSRHKQFLEVAKKGDVEVLFIGDSITQGWEGSGKDAWKKNFEPMKAANFGIGGDRTQHIIWRITEGKELEGITPKVAVMMIGTNNTGGNTAEDIAKGIKAILAEFAKQKPNMKVLLLAVFPRAGGIANDEMVAPKEKLNKKIDQINDIIKGYADGRTVFYKDINAKFLTSDGGLSREIMKDLLHLTAKGYEIEAEAIKPEIEKLLK